MTATETTAHPYFVAFFTEGEDIASEGMYLFQTEREAEEFANAWLGAEIEAGIIVRSQVLMTQEKGMPLHLLNEFEF